MYSTLIPVSAVHLWATGLMLPRDPDGSRMRRVTTRPLANSFAAFAASA